MPQLQAVAAQENYRSFHINVAASVRFGGVLITATLTGGPNQIARIFGVPATDPDPAIACAGAVDELRKVIDDLLNAPVPASVCFPSGASSLD